MSIILFQFPELGLGVGETGYMYVKSKEVRWYVSIYITLWHVHVPRYVRIPRTDQNRPGCMHLAIAIHFIAIEVMLCYSS